MMVMKNLHCLYRLLINRQTTVYISFLLKPEKNDLLLLGSKDSKDGISQTTKLTKLVGDVLLPSVIFKCSCSLIYRVENILPLSNYVYNLNT